MHGYGSLLIVTTGSEGGSNKRDKYLCLSRYCISDLSREKSRNRHTQWNRD